MNLFRSLSLATAALLLSQAALAQISCTPDLTTDFEFNDSSGQFTLGTAPKTVTFVGGSSISIGNFDLYQSGFFAWMITPGVSATIAFDTPAKEVEFFVRNQSATTQSVVTVFGTDGSVLATVIPTSAAFTTVSVASTNPQISHATVAQIGGTGMVAVEDLSYCANDVGTSFCFGDGGDQLGCTDCPCMNNAPVESTGGCINGAGGSAHLVALGAPTIGVPALRMEMSGGNPSTFGVLTSGDNQLPANMVNACFGLNSGVTSVALDGLRCVGANGQRHGARPTDTNGDIGLTTNGWGPPNGPAGGIAAQGGFGVGQTRHFQVFYREDDVLQCLTGQNTSQGVTITFLP